MSVPLAADTSARGQDASRRAHLLLEEMGFTSRQARALAFQRWLLETARPSHIQDVVHAADDTRRSARYVAWYSSHYDAINDLTSPIDPTLCELQAIPRRGVTT